MFYGLYSLYVLMSPLVHLIHHAQCVHGWDLITL